MKNKDAWKEPLNMTKWNEYALDKSKKKTIKNEMTQNETREWEKEMEWNANEKATQLEHGEWWIRWNWKC